MFERQLRSLYERSKESRNSPRDHSTDADNFSNGGTTDSPYSAYFLNEEQIRQRRIRESWHALLLRVARWDSCGASELNSKQIV
jgi:hypothetical protein